MVGEHDTPLRSLFFVPEGTGTFAIAQRFPFHISTTRWNTCVWSWSPTATHCDALVHEMPVRLTALAPCGFGLATIDHVVPVNCSTSDPLAEPTAMHTALVVHVIPERSVNLDVGGFGLGTTLHEAPFQCSISVFVRVLVS